MLLIEVCFVHSVIIENRPKVCARIFWTNELLLVDVKQLNREMRQPLSLEGNH